MGLAGGSAPLPYGHSADAAVDIEGLSVRGGIVGYLSFPEQIVQLLEDHLKILREEEGVELDDEDDEAMWNGWDVESDEDSESDEEDWINVDSDDDEDLVVSDSDDEKEKLAEPTPGNTEASNRVSALATTKVNTTAPPLIRTTQLVF